MKPFLSLLVISFISHLAHASTPTRETMDEINGNAENETESHVYNMNDTANDTQVGYEPGAAGTAADRYNQLTLENGQTISVKTGLAPIVEPITSSDR